MEFPVGVLTCYIFVVAIVLCEAGSCQKGSEKKCPDGTCVTKGKTCSQESQLSANSAVKNVEENDNGNNSDGDGKESPSTPIPDMEVNTLGETKCPSTHLSCNNGKCYRPNEQCDGRDQCGDKTDELRCGSPNLLGVWPWYHWVLACAFGGAACILAVYGVYLVIARRRQLAQDDGFRIGDRESLDNSGTPVRFVSRDAMQNKYNSINQDNDRNN